MLSRVRSLLEVLPVSIPALRSQPVEASAGPLFRQLSGPSSQQTPYVTIRGLRLPDTLNPVVESEMDAQVQQAVIRSPWLAFRQ